MDGTKKISGCCWRSLFISHHNYYYREQCWFFFNRGYTGYWMYTRPTISGVFISNLQYIILFYLQFFINFDFYFVQAITFFRREIFSASKCFEFRAYYPWHIFYIGTNYAIKTGWFKVGNQSFFTGGGAVSFSIILCFMLFVNQK